MIPSQTSLTADSKACQDGNRRGIRNRETPSHFLIAFVNSILTRNESLGADNYRTSHDQVTIIVKSSRQDPTFSEPAAEAQNHKFVIHKDFICYHSPFFSSAFTSDFREGPTQLTELDDIDPEAFAILVNWIYTSKVVDAKRQRPDLVTCAKVWVLGDQFLMRKLQNDTMRSIHEILRPCDHLKEVDEFGQFAKIAGSHGEGDNPLARIAVRMMCWTNEVFFNRWIQELPQSILIPLSITLKKCERKVWAHDVPPAEAMWVGDVTKFFMEEK